ncbi:MAG: glycosyltransferase family 1 protein [Pseudomonadota bacterium]
MKIGIFVDILTNKKTGVEYYTQNLLQHLLEMDIKNQYCLIRHDGVGVDFESEKKYTEIVCKKRNQSILFLRRFINVLPRQITLTVIRQILKFVPSIYYSTNKKLRSFDILFSPNFGLELETNPRAYQIVIVYDITPIRVPQCHNKEVGIFFNAVLGDILKKADKIIAISEFTKRDLITHYGIVEEKISVIYPGLNRHMTRTPKSCDIVKKYNLPEDFILSFGTLEPRKNAIAVVKSFALLKKDGRREMLVIAGRKGWGYEDVFVTLKQLGLEKSVLFTGYVDEEDVPGLYGAARLLVYPALYEGFGLPVIEAMSCGCPVITSSTSSLPEAGGDAALYIDPTDEKQIYEAMKKVIGSEELRGDMIMKGLIQASKFNWDESARKVIKIFEEAERAMHNERI